MGRQGGLELNPAVSPSTPTGAAIPQTVHTVANETVAPLPFENPPHLQFNGRFSGSKLTENEIMFKQVFPNGDLDTRDCLRKLRTIASGQVRSNLGDALT